MTQRQQAAFQIFRTQYSERGSAAIVGSLSGESGPTLDSTLNRANPDASGGRQGADRSGGIAEWLNQTPGQGRKSNLIAFAGALGKPPEALETQCLFVIHELDNGDDGNSPGQYAGLRADLVAGTKTVQTLTYDFTKFYERPDMAVAHLDDVRVPAAERVLRESQPFPVAIGAGPVTQTPVAQATMPIPPPSAHSPEVELSLALEQLANAKKRVLAAIPAVVDDVSQT